MDSPSFSSWQAAALSGDFAQLHGAVSEIVGQNWPEYQDRIHLREFALPPPPGSDAPAYYARLQAEDTARYLAMVEKAIIRHAAQRNVLIEPADMAPLFHETGPAYSAMMDKYAPMNPRNAEAGALGRALYSSQAYSYVPASSTEQKVEQVGFAVLSIHAEECERCLPQKASLLPNGQCRPILPDEVMGHRLEYFATAAHELAHGIRKLNGVPPPETPEEARREEGIGRVFEHLMLAKAAGPLGLVRLEQAVIQMRQNPADNYLYETSAPLQAALEVARDPDRMAKLSPRDLFDLSVALVQNHDPVPSMSGPEREAYKQYLAHASMTRQGIEKRQRNVLAAEAKGVTPFFTTLAILPTGKGGPAQATSIDIPYTEPMRRLDKLRLSGLQEERTLSQKVSELNPLAVDSLKGLTPGEVPATITGLEDLVRFSRNFNAPDCTASSLTPRLQRDAALGKLENK